MKKLTPFLGICPDESFASWVTRLAGLHLGEHLVMFLHDVGIELHEVRHGSEAALAKLAEITGHDLPSLRRNAIQQLKPRNFDASSAEAAALLIKTSLQRSELPAFMNTTRGQIIMLIEAGYLKKNSETGKTKASYAGAVSRESAVEFLNALRASAVEVHDIPDGFMNIPSAAQKSRVTCPRIIELILEGGLKSIIRVAGIEGYSSIHVSPTELIEQANLVPKEQPITVFRARNLIGLTQQAMSFLISDAAGEDRIIVTPGSIGRPATVSNDEVNCFSERFMTLFQLCKVTGRHHILLNREVQSAGVKPAFNPAMIGTTIFRRQDLRPWLDVPPP